MRATLKHRIIIPIIMFAVALVSVFSAIQVQSQLRATTMLNAARAEIAAQSLKQALNEMALNDEAGKAPVSILRALGHSTLFSAAYVYSSDGLVEASTNNAYVGSRASAVELGNIRQALHKHSRVQALDDAPFVQSIHKDVDKPTRTLSLYVPAAGKNGLVYVGRIDVQLGSMQQAFKQLYIPLMLTALFVIILSALFGSTLLRRVANPIAALNTAAKEIAAGDKNLTIHIDTKDELEELSDTINALALKLKDKH